MVCEHAALMDMLYDRSFKVPERYVEECAEVRKRAGRWKGVHEAENERKVKKNEWDVIICGGGDETDEEEPTCAREFDRIVDRRGGGLSDSQISSGGEVLNSGMIPTPSWRKVDGMESELSSASTYLSDGKMGRWTSVPYMPRGQYAMGAPRANMGHCMKTWVPDAGTESSEWEHMSNASDVIYIVSYFIIGL